MTGIIGLYFKKTMRVIINADLCALQKNCKVLS